MKTTCVLLLLSSSVGTTNALSQPKPPVFPPAQRLTSNEFRRAGVVEDRPILVTDALDPDACEALCHQWIQTAGDETITVQRKRQGTKLYECTVAQSLDLMMQSTPKDSIFAFVEGGLELGSSKNSSIQTTLTEPRETLFDDPNWFDYFPPAAQPTDCVVIAGQGATSTLHRDPFEWTGTSLCLEGRKIWRFLEPTTDYDELLQSYRLESTAWSSSEEEEEVILSAGWQSDDSLYHCQQPDKIRSARDLAELPESKAEAYLKELAGTSHPLAPPKDFWNAPMEGVSVVQHPGELLIIPPYWYHQTYSPEPSLAVASQRCGSRVDAVRVMNHILSLQEESSLPGPLQTLVNGEVDPTTLDPKEMIDLLFDHLGKQSDR